MYRISFTISLLFVSMQFALAQIDLQCNDRDMHSIYLVGNSGFYRIDSVDTNPTNPIFLMQNTPGAIGISINNDLNSGGPVTMYSCDNLYYFWDGSGWINTGHTTGNSSAVNPGGSADYIFNLNDNGNSLYRYDGTGTNTLLLSNIGTSNDFVHDVAADNQGNFYLFFTNAQKIVAYTPNGIPVDTFMTTGFASGSQCGIAILGDRIYATTCSGSYELYEGIKTGNTINFTMIKNFAVQSSDIAACPSAAQPLAVFENPNLPRFAVYPNPAKEIAIIKLQNTTTLEIYDCMGVLRTAVPTRGLTEYHLNVTEWKSGVYLINAVSEEKTSARGKLVVE